MIAYRNEQYYYTSLYITKATYHKEQCFNWVGHQHLSDLFL